MKRLYTLLFSLSFLTTFAQPPAGYYDSATGTGYILKTQLKVIITNGHNDQGYASLWNLFQTAPFRDNFYDNDGSLIDMYSENPMGDDPYNFTNSSQQCGNYAGEGDCYNREHLVPQAYFENVAINPMKNDPHHVIPVDGKVNGVRDNFPFGRVNSPTYTSANGSKLGLNTDSGYSAGYSATVFEPLDEFKGDIARCFLYFATRYEDQMDEFYASASVQSKDMFNGSINQVFSPTFLNILLTWNALDLPSVKEIARNNSIYFYQGNRNPYIDNNFYVTAIWGAPLSTATFDPFDNISIFPNPSNDRKISISSESDIDEILLLNINGQLIRQIKNPISHDKIYTFENLPGGFYFLKLISDNQSATRKVIVN